MTTIVVAMLPTVALVLIALVVLPLLDRRKALTRLTLSAIGIALTAQYVAWRIMDTMPPLTMSFASLYAWAYLPFDIALCCMLAFFFVSLSRSIDRGPDATRQRSWLNKQPSPPLVDVLIPTYNEDLEVLEPTIVGILAMEHERVRVWVLDDGRRPWLREYCKVRGVRYLDRPDNEHAKAGNMNHGLEAIRRETEQPVYVAVFDADFVPTPEFLQRTLPLFQDSKVGLVQTPQHFYSDGPIQLNLRVASWWMDEQRQHFDTLLPARDAWSAAYCSGTSSVVRYEALLSIGGFPTESVTEDYLTYLKLRREGWRTLYLNERLSHGLAPAGVSEYVGQRARWCLGTMQIVRSAWGPFSRQPLPFLSRLHLFDHLAYWAISPAIRIVNLCVPVLYWFTGVFVMETDAAEALLRFAPFYIGIHVLIAWMSAGRILPVLNDVNHTLMAFDVVRAARVGLLRPMGQRFRVTLKRTMSDRIIVHGELVRKFMIIVLLHVVGIVTFLTTDLGPAPDDGPLPLVVFWTLINLTVIGLATLACVERPRRRRDERLVANEPARMSWSGSWTPVTLKELSLSGARLEVAQAPQIGTRATLELDGLEPIDATIVRPAGRGAVAVSFAVAGARRDAMIRKLFSGRYGVAPEEVGLTTTLKAMIAWIVGRMPARAVAIGSEGPMEIRPVVGAAMPSELGVEEASRRTNVDSTGARGDA